MGGGGGGGGGVDTYRFKISYDCKDSMVVKKLKRNSHIFLKQFNSTSFTLVNLM